ncbi:MAG: MBL fold metallo-hydrolase [Syntrophobacteraceae bacterium]|nr:MBL fold metallo-hydrolase [Syntrophobacteraceae bacterium]
MRITCLGASRCVTGSCFLLDNGRQYLIDCGLFQGGKKMEALNRKEWGFSPRQIAAVFLTHAHIDHCGRIPKLVKDGFRGKIFTTLPTAELVKILLLDSAHIQEMEAEWESRKNRRRGRPDVAPLYTVKEAEDCFPLLEPVAVDERVDLASDLSVCFRNAGHILGSSILEIWCGSETSPHKVVFTGDLGHKHQLIVKDPYHVHRADTLFLESTYGNRNHKSIEESRKELIEAIHYSHQHGEKVMIPAFAVARTQELLFLLGEFFRKGLIPRMPVYLDSPLAIAATSIFRRMREFYDDETLAVVNKGHDPFDFPQLVLSRTAEESMAINLTAGPAIVIAGNGMCTAGRIKHHLKHNLWRKGASLVVVGFQAAGTTGRSIVEGASSVRIFGENIVVRAKVFTIGGFSAHADQKDLLDWLSHLDSPHVRINVIHGEEEISRQFAAVVRQRFGYRTYVPAIGETIHLEAAPPDVGIELKAAERAGRERVSALLRKARALEHLLESAPESVPPEMLEAVEEGISEIERRIDALIQSIG